MLTCRQYRLEMMRMVMMLLLKLVMTMMTEMCFSLNSFLRVRTPSSRYQGRLSQKMIAQSPPPPPPVTRVVEVLTVTHKPLSDLCRTKNTRTDVILFLSRCEGAGEHPESSVVRPPWRGAQNTPPLFPLICCCSNRGQPWRTRRRR